MLVNLPPLGWFWGRGWEFTRGFRVGDFFFSPLLILWNPPPAASARIADSFSVPPLPFLFSLSHCTKLIKTGSIAISHLLVFRIVSNLFAQTILFLAVTLAYRFQHQSKSPPFPLPLLHKRCCLSERSGKITESDSSINKRSLPLLNTVKII